MLICYWITSPFLRKMCYSQTGCSFDGNFANFRRNIGILIDSLSRASCNLRKQVAIAFVPFSKIIWKAVCDSKFLLWLMMANIHYNRITRLKKGENNCPVDVCSVQNRHKSQKKLDYRLKRYLTLTTVNSMCIYGHMNATVAVPSPVFI